MDIWLNHETSQLMRPIQPILDDMMTPNPVAK